MKDGKPQQYHTKYTEKHFTLLDFTATDEEGVRCWEEARTRRPLSLYDSPLYDFTVMKIDENTAGVLVVTHHLISDGWTQVSICNKIGRTYIDLTAGKEFEIEPLPSYSLFVEDEKNYLASDLFKKDQEYWRKLTSKRSEPSSFKSIISAAVSTVGSHKSFVLSDQLNNAIYEYCLENRTAPFLVFYMALAIYLKKTGGVDRFTIGVPVFNRSSYKFKKTTGMFVSTVPFFSEISANWTFNEFCSHLSENWYELLRHQRFPFEQIKRLSNTDGPLFNLMLSYQDNKLLQSDFDPVSFSGCWHYGGHQSEQLCIHIMNLEDNRRYSVDYDYLSQLFSDREIEKLHESLCCILEGALKSPENPIRDLKIISELEYEKVIYEFNRTSHHVKDFCPYSLLLSFASKYPQRAALIQSGERVTYGALINEGRSVAAALPTGAGLTAILLPKSPQLFSAMVGIMQSGGAWVIISPDIPSKRICAILKQSEASALVSSKWLINKVEGLKELDIKLVDMEALPSPEERVCPYSPDSLAYVVYTSGSTGEPKGVEITNRNLINFVQGVSPIFSGRAVLSLCNISFDAFILESAAAMLCGKTIVLPTDTDHENPTALAELIKNYAVGFMAMTPSRLAAYVKDPSFADSLSGVESIVCGGEAFPSELVQKLKLFTNAKIYNQYGPSETTVGVSYSVLNEASLITVGRPMPNCRLYVLDEMLAPLPVGVRGDLYIGGVCVGNGYRGSPQLTKEAFLKNPFEPGDRLYRTGDIASWTESGEIVLSGRRDRQLKLHGLRIEPQEISACLMKSPKVTDSAVKVVSYGDAQMLVAYCIASDHISEAELLAFAASQLPRYMIPSRIIFLDSIPLTANGKIDESALPVPEFENDFQPAENMLQERILSILKTVLGDESFHAGSDYFLSGGNSLNAMEALGEVEDKLGIRLRVSDLYACRTVKRLEQYISGLSAEILPTTQSFLMPPQERYAVTAMQRNVYVQSLMNLQGLTYNMPGEFRLGFTPDISRLESAFTALIEGDDIFRTSFEMNGTEVLAVISKNVTFSLPVFLGSREDALQSFVSPFDLSKAPLIRAALFKDSGGGWSLLIDCHHIICDGLSTPIIMERINKLYSGADCPVSYTFGSYACLKHEAMGSGDGDYWFNKLSPLPDSLDLPLDKPRPSVFDYKGSNISHSISGELTGRIDEYCEKQGVTPYMLLLSAFGILISKASGQKDILVGTPLSNRGRPELRSVCGLFINTLPLRMRPEGELKGYLNDVRDSVLGMIDHPDLPLDEIITRLNIPRTLSKNPLYQILFSMRPLDSSAFELDGHKLIYVPISTNSSKLDLSFEVAREGDTYTFYAEYCLALFNKETIAIYLRSFEKIISQITEGEVSFIEHMTALSDEDWTNIYDKQNSKYISFDDRPINRIIEQTALQNQQKTAVIWHGQNTSFGEINDRSNAIAAMLAKNGVKRGDRVGLVCSRTPDLFASMLGILKAGGAYVPFLADYPEDRVCYMLENAGARLLLSDPVSAETLPKMLPCDVVLTTDAIESEAVVCEQQTSDPMYVLYTSGSTGKPKGVQVPHRALGNLLESLRKLMSGHVGPVLCTTNVTFDIFITESLLALASGFCVVLADEEEMMLPWKTAELIKKHHTKITQFTPSRLQMNLSNNAFADAAAEIEFVILVGEAVTPSLVDTFKKHSRGRFVNMYGPTEAAVYVTQGELSSGLDVNIGVPLNNCRIYVLDENQKPVMPTARGELYLSGTCLADGYISRPDLTDAVFVPDPFVTGQKMYRSGDAGRLRSDGVLECFGRLDSQIKINGNRVELEEINAAMVKAGANQAATVALKNADGSTSLYGFVSPESLDISELKKNIGKALLPYMVPAQIRRLNKLPYNASGKIDMPVLKKMILSSGDNLDTDSKTVHEEKQEKDISPLSTEYSESGSVTPNQLIEIWQDTLGLEGLSPDNSFFEQGGSSLGALSILSQYYNLGLTMTMEEFYHNSTAKEQANLLNSSQLLPCDEIEVRASFPAEVPAQKEPIHISDVKCVLFTGASGFLGAHLINSLLERGVEKIICPLRDGDRNRLLETLTWYFGEGWAFKNSAHIEVVRGDITIQNLGLEASQYSDISSRIDIVFHTAADVRHFTSGSVSSDVNLRGTENMIELALIASVPLIHISTASISGEYIKGNVNKKAVFRENDFDIGQNWENNTYIRTKFLAENAIYSAMSTRGLEARVFRAGRLVGRSSDGVFQKNAGSNAFYSLVQGICALGAISESLAGIPVEITPVDLCAESILALCSAPITAYHIIQRNAAPLGNIVKEIYPELEIVDDKRFDSMLTLAVSDEGDVIAPLIDTYNRFKTTPFTVFVSSEKTHEYLSGLGCEWPEVDPGKVLVKFGGNIENKVR